MQMKQPLCNVALELPMTAEHVKCIQYNEKTNLAVILKSWSEPVLSRPLDNKAVIGLPENISTLPRTEQVWSCTGKI